MPPPLRLPLFVEAVIAFALLRLRVTGVCQISEGNPVQAAADMRRVNGASRNIECLAGVVFTRQIRSHSVEPTVPSRSSNLFAKDDRRSDGGNEPKEVRPQMPWIVGPKSFSRNAERLARAGAGPDGAVVEPSGETQGVRPSADPGEEVRLREASEVISGNIDN